MWDRLRQRAVSSGVGRKWAFSLSFGIVRLHSLCHYLVYIAIKMCNPRFSTEGAFKRGMSYGDFLVLCRRL